MAKKKKKARKKAKKPMLLSRRRCFTFGHEVMKMQCGIAWALNELDGTGVKSERTASADKIRVAMKTVKKFAVSAGKMLHSAREDAKKLAEGAEVFKHLDRGTSISGERAQKMEAHVRGLLKISTRLAHQAKNSCQG